MDTHQQKISHLKALYHLASADNEVSTLEVTYINKVAEHPSMPCLPRSWPSSGSI